jgi:hypothetical protein
LKLANTNPFSGNPACLRVGGDHAFGVVDLKAIGQAHHLLGVEHVFARRNHDGIGNDVVDEIRAQGAGMTEIVHLDRRRAGGENAGPGIAAMAHEVDRDVDLVVADALGDVAVAQRTHVVKRIEGRHRAGA